MAKRLQVVMAQLNLRVGAIAENTTRILAAARSARAEQQADIVVFPELSLVGYPPEDLLLRPSLQRRVQRALDTLVNARLDVILVVGLPWVTEAGIYNALVVIGEGRVLGTYFKQCLPNYQVFDERRYFISGDGPCVINLFGVPIAFTICEDLWHSEPTVQARDAGARLLININASPYHMDKVRERRHMLRERAIAGDMPILYCNLVGGQDELVFDGASMAVDAGGVCRLLAPAFQEGCFPVSLAIEESANDLRVTLESQAQAPGLSLEAEVYQALVMGVRDYVEKNGFPGVVIGLSGGIDSALTLAIAVDALGPARVRAVMMPFAYTSALSLDAAAEQAGRLEVDYRVIPIAAIYTSFMNALQSEFAGRPEDVSEQNIQARCRGVLLMAISNKQGLLVLTTGNKSEIAVGYCTLYGDMAGGFDVLKDVSKTLVYRLADYRNGLGDPVIPQTVIDRPPSAELAPGQVDQDNLPPYDILDQILERYVEQDQSAADIVAAGFDESTVRRVVRLVDINEYKRRQSPVGVRLTQRGFGRDRRYPITNGWEIGD